MWPEHWAGPRAACLPCEIMPWSKVHVDDAILTLWPVTPVREKDMYGPKGLPMFFKEAFDIEVTPVGCVT